MIARSRIALLPATVTGLAVAAGARASASVVYSGALNETFTLGNEVDLDLNGDGFADVSMSVVSADYTKPTFAAQNSALLTGDLPAGQSVMDQDPTSVSYWGNNLLSTQYFGIEVAPISGTTPLYGWVEYGFDGTDTGTLLGYAYETSGGDILTGQTVDAVPEPSGAGMAAGAAALLAGSVVLWRRRKAITPRLA